MVAFDESGGHWHCVAHVRKAFAADTIDRELSNLRRSQVNPGKVPDRMIVFRVAQSSEGHGPRVTRSHGCFGVECPFNPVQKLVTFILARLKCLLGGHVTKSQSFGDHGQHFGRGEYGVRGVEAR